MNYVLFGMLALMFIAYVILNRNKKKKRSNSSHEQEEKLKELEEAIEKIKTEQS